MSLSFGEATHSHTMHMKMYLICLLIRCDESKPSLPPLWCSSYLVFCLYRILMLFCVQYQQILSTCDGVSLEVLFEFEWKGQPSISWHAAMSLILHNLMSLRMFFVHTSTLSGTSPTCMLLYAKLYTHDWKRCQFKADSNYSPLFALVICGSVTWIFFTM